MDDILIDSILNQIASKEDYLLITDEVYFKSYKDFQNYRACISWLIQEGILIKPLNNHTKLSLTSLGKEIISQSGWLKYNLKQLEKSKSDKARQERKDKSDEIDLKIKQWTYKARYTPFIFSGLAFLGTVISIIISIKALNFKKEQEGIQTMEQKKLESESRIQSQDLINQKDTTLNKQK